MTALIKSYTSETSWNALWREARCLYQNHRKGAASRVAGYIDELRSHEAMIRSRYGRELEDLDVLDIGPGPFLVQMTYFAQRNRVTGIDLNVVPNGFAIGQYIEMWRRNGLRRTLKTIIRKAMGIDWQYRREVAKRLGPLRKCANKVLWMDARDLRFSEKSFDFVHSRSVLHHIPEPAAALRETARVLRPGGIALVSFHLFTSETGSLDPRVFTDARPSVDRWPHLRSTTRANVNSNAFLNGWRLEDWKSAIQEVLPRAEIILRQNKRLGAEAEARALQATGELSGFSLEELLTDEVLVIWQKPSPGN